LLSAANQHDGLGILWAEKRWRGSVLRAHACHNSPFTARLGRMVNRHPDAGAGKTLLSTIGRICGFAATVRR
jgi:hypothetical protein